MSSKVTRSIAVGAVTAAALTGAAVVAPDASAKVSEGRYRSTTVIFGATTRSYIAVIGTTLTDFGPLGAQRFRIVGTPRGGFVDAYGARHILNRLPGGAYGGPVYLGPFVVGNTHLRPTDD